MKNKVKYDITDHCSHKCKLTTNKWNSGDHTLKEILYINIMTLNWLETLENKILMTTINTKPHKHCM